MTGNRSSIREAATGWLVAHLVVLAILATQVVKRWMARRDGLSAAAWTGLL